MCAASSSRTTRCSSQHLFTRALTAPVLPPEVIDCVLSCLPQHDLRQVARASRAFYAHALQAGLHIHVGVVWSGSKPHVYRRALDKLNLVLDHASVRRALNLSIRAEAVPPRNDAHKAAYLDAIRMLGPSLRRALPKLARLHCAFPHLEADAGLCEQPARKLRTLTLTDLPARIPPNLFNGDAPKLRYVAFVLADTDAMSAWGPIAAFARVTHLKLSAKSIPARLQLTHLFPALRVLSIDAADAPSTQTVDLRGLALRHISLAGDIRHLDAASRDVLKHMSVFEHLTDDVETGIWPAESDELCAFAERCGGKPGISVGPRDGAWRRTIVSTYLQHGALPLADLPHLGQNLASLTVDESLVTAFVQAPVVLDRLRELIVDVTTARDRWEPFQRLYFAVPRVHCPALVRLVLLCLPEADTFAVRVAPDKIVRVGRALNMRDARPVLALAGCAWTWTPIPPTDAELLQLFSSLRTDELVNENVPEYYDTCRYSGYFDSPGWD